jgi:transposase
MTGPAELVTCDQTIERTIARLKQHRAIATRYDKRAVNFLAAIHLAAAVVWLN